LKLTKDIEDHLSFVLKFNEDIYKAFQNWIIKEHYNDYLKIFQEKENREIKNINLFLKQVKRTRRKPDDVNYNECEVVRNKFDGVKTNENN
jgi:hypothetical protein